MTEDTHRVSGHERIETQKCRLIAGTLYIVVRPYIRGIR